MSVDAAAGAAIKGSEEERCTGRWVQSRRFADIFTGRRRILGSRVGKDKDLIGFDELLLYAGGSNEDVFITTDGGLVRKVS